MRHQNTVFHDLLKLVPWSVFDRLTEAYEADHRVRRLSTKQQFIAMLYAQLSGAASLREIVAGLESHGPRLYHLGARPVHRSTLADANSRRPAEVFTNLFAELVSRARRGVRRKVGEAATYLIDSTSLPVSGTGAQWARFSATACGAKAHVMYEESAEHPVYFSVTAANVNDITAAEKMPIEAGATYVFDLAYYDFAWWAELAKAECRIVTRFKRNTPLKEAEEREVPPDSDVLSDHIGWLPRRQARNRINPFSHRVREVRVKTDTGKILRVLTNDLDAPAQTIADLYKRRWAIELFFRWVKQTLKIRHFLGKSKNAVQIQVAVAFIAYLLLRLAHASQKAVKGPLAFARLVRINLMHRKRMDRLLQPAPPPASNPKQMVLQCL